MTCGEDQPVVSPPARHAFRGRRDDLFLLPLVDEAAVRHLDDHLVATLELVELVEGRAVGRAMARYPDRAVNAGERRLGIVARPLSQRPAVGPLDDNLVDADLRDADPADRV